MTEGTTEATLYYLCRKPGCFHFVEDNAAKDDAPGLAEYVHLEDGEQEFDHDAVPMPQGLPLAQWQKDRPELFREYPDGKIGPNSSHFKDSYALDQLAEILRRPTWPSGADFIEWTASIVRRTGRAL